MSQLERLHETPSSVLCIYAHPDDADVAAAGTLSRWVKEGASVHLLVVADGGRGSMDAATPPTEIAAARAEELEAACAMTGISFEVCGFGDGTIENTEDLRRLLVERIRTLQPTTVLTHDPTAIFFGQHYFNHADHRALGWAVLDAVSPAAAMPHYFPGAGAPHKVAHVLLSGTLEPTCLVDISSSLDVKINAVACHRSQFAGDEEAIGDVLRLRATDDGRKGGVKAAELFRSLRLHG